MSQPSLAIPPRKSSINAPNAMRMAKSSQDNLRCDKPSKAHKILGETDIPLRDHHKRDESNRGVRASFVRANFMRASQIKSKNGGSFVPFPAATPDASIPPQPLRVRASSPLLGHEYRSQDGSLSPIPKPSKKIHQSGSSSTLFSYFNSKDSPVEPNPPNLPYGIATKDFGLNDNNSSSEQQSNTEPRIGLRQPKGPMKDAKRKVRPPRIDLSLLFPKPRATEAPLLSPQRMVNSPSPISVTSEYPSAKVKRPEDFPIGKKATKISPPEVSAHKSSGHQTADNVSELSVSRESSRNLDWLEASFVRTVKTSEFDLALDKYHHVQTAKAAIPAKRSQTREHLRSSDSKSPEKTSKNMSSNSSVGGLSKETYLSPKTCSRPKPNRVSETPNKWHDDKSLAVKGPISKKSSKNSLGNVDLSKSSVLCLSSSEDEDEEDEEPLKGHVEYNLDVEICTAAAAKATKGQTLRRRNRGSQIIESNQLGRNPPMSSAGKSSYATRKKNRSRPTNDVPTVSESDTDTIISQFRSPPLSLKERNRRSRVMSVTRQEEQFLEAMRHRKGKVTPSLFQEARYNYTLEPGRGSLLSAPSRDSFYGDTSFLRLSPGIPHSPRSDQGAHYTDKDSTISRGDASDAEQKTIHSSVSPRASLVYSESLPSPATSGASPLTPTLPIHRFSPLPQQTPPPSRPPPVVPEMQRRHSRRRTDSSAAIILDEAEAPKEREEFPIWAFGWSHDGGNLTVVH